jgi:hypothetical protein
MAVTPLQPDDLNISDYLTPLRRAIHGGGGSHDDSIEVLLPVIVGGR